MSHVVNYHTRALHLKCASRHERTATNYRYASTPVGNFVIPDPAYFNGLDDRLKDELPTAAQCAVHLELLEAFHALKIRIIECEALDGIFGIKAPTKTIYRRKYMKTLNKYVNQEVTVKVEGWEAKREKKWLRYLDFAADRFVTWAEVIDKEIAATEGNDDQKLEIRLPWLPPLDVLMVWHAFLLNPSDYINYCRAESLTQLHRVSFPWTRIHEAIDSQGPRYRAWFYQLPKDNEDWLRNKDGIDPNLHQYLVNLGKPIGFTMRSGVSSDKNTTGILSLTKPKDQSKLAKSLIANVQRQSVFVDKMHAHLWIRSPGLGGTMNRAVERYENFLELFQLYPGKMLVPNLDIDLAWHTNQLSAAGYKATMESRCGRFINHDDKIGKSTLRNGMSDTESLYRIHFGDEYSVCLCWECQAIASAIEDADKDGDLFETGSFQFASNITDKVQGDVDYYRAVEIARRKNFVNLPLRRS
ncbi:hypothetical protein MRS44_009112 [Fusarium solani]|uniref:uncharacterized protein n=1 Tax=Fusarium solani TaxID=169388 RepID=UPI0032C3E6FB|nr:hypothetical protein MRS44_009112 [Fusarium solani]